MQVIIASTSEEKPKAFNKPSMRFAQLTMHATCSTQFHVSRVRCDSHRWKPLLSIHAYSISLCNFSPYGVVLHIMMANLSSIEP